MTLKKCMFQISIMHGFNGIQCKFSIIRVYIAMQIIFSVYLIFSMIPLIVS